MLQSIIFPLPVVRILFKERPAVDVQPTFAGQGYPLGGASGVRCPRCGSNDIATGAYLTQTGHVGLSIGIAYKLGGIMTGTETLQADLCRCCDTVRRFFATDPGRSRLQR